VDKNRQLAGVWRAIHGAVWLIGIAILAWKGWWWPGILVLVAISGIVEALIRYVAPPEVAQELTSEDKDKGRAEPAPVPPQPAQAVDAPAHEHRADLLPSECPKCGAPVRGNEVHWTGSQSADCPYCGANLPMQDTN
jgi:hypothetical protein